MFREGTNGASGQSAGKTLATGPSLRGELKHLRMLGQKKPDHNVGGP